MQRELAGLIEEAAALQQQLSELEAQLCQPEHSQAPQPEHKQFFELTRRLWEVQQAMRDLQAQQAAQSTQAADAAAWRARQEARRRFQAEHVPGAAAGEAAASPAAAAAAAVLTLPTCSVALALTWRWRWRASWYWAEAGRRRQRATQRRRWAARTPRRQVAGHWGTTPAPTTCSPCLGSMVRRASRACQAKRGRASWRCGLGEAVPACAQQHNPSLCWPDERCGPCCCQVMEALMTTRPCGGSRSGAAEHQRAQPPARRAPRRQRHRKHCRGVFMLFQALCALLLPCPSPGSPAALLRLELVQPLSPQFNGCRAAVRTAPRVARRRRHFPPPPALITAPLSLQAAFSGQPAPSADREQAVGSLPGRARNGGGLCGRRPGLVRVLAACALAQLLAGAGARPGAPAGRRADSLARLVAPAAGRSPQARCPCPHGDGGLRRRRWRCV